MATTRYRQTPVASSKIIYTGYRSSSALSTGYCYAQASELPFFFFNKYYSKQIYHASKLCLTKIYIQFINTGNLALVQEGPSLT
jgi:hypothetical protein